MQVQSLIWEQISEVKASLDFAILIPLNEFLEDRFRKSDVLIGTFTMCVFLIFTRQLVKYLWTQNLVGLSASIGSKIPGVKSIVSSKLNEGKLGMRALVVKNYNSTYKVTDLIKKGAGANVIEKQILSMHDEEKTKYST
jgi:hypothetical protein